MRHPAVFWLTGLPGSGKTALALAAREAFPSIVVLHMDEMRRVVTPSPSYSDEERERVYRALVFTAMVLAREGKGVVIDATANRRAWRELARGLVPNFHEIYVRCPAELCREREARRVDEFAPGGVYEKGGAGWPVPGVNVPYEEPENPELTIDCGELAVSGAAEKFVKYIKGVLQ